MSTLKEKVLTYERLFHALQACSITMDRARQSEILSIINDWSYAHRVGNGEHSIKQQQAIVDRQFERMKQV